VAGKLQLRVRKACMVYSNVFIQFPFLKEAFWTLETLVRSKFVDVSDMFHQVILPMKTFLTKRTGMICFRMIFHVPQQTTPIFEMFGTFWTQMNRVIEIPQAFHML
jgi:hypothetical protein